MYVDPLLPEVEAFQKLHLDADGKPMSDLAFGVAAGYRNVVYRLRGGHRVSRDTLERVRAYMAQANAARAGSAAP